MDINEKTLIQHKNVVVGFTEDEVKVALKYLIEDSINFHVTMLKDLDELGIDLPEELNANQAKQDFLSCPNLFKKLKMLGIDTQGLENLK